VQRPVVADGALLAMIGRAQIPGTANLEPAYVALLASGELGRRVGEAYRHLEDCDLCARYCHVDRRRTIRGAACRTGERAVVNSFGPHHGEEDPLRGRDGSGTTFFSWCNLRCVFCHLNIMAQYPVLPGL
jgi:putative pyruvate formate lyase activating enzyme